MSKATVPIGLRWPLADEPTSVEHTRLHDHRPVPGPGKHAINTAKKWLRLSLDVNGGWRRGCSRGVG